VQSDLALRVLSYGVVGLLWITGLALTFASLRKEERYDEPLTGLFLLTLVIIGFCSFIALCSAYQATTSLQKLAPRLQTETVKVQ